MNQYPWHPHYVEAMLAANPNQRLISAAEKAINTRLQDSLRGQSLRHCELEAARYALKHLRLLKQEIDGLFDIEGKVDGIGLTSSTAFTMILDSQNQQR